jgi:hypothetical protein
MCVDEKSQIQALDRTQPGLPLKKGRSGTMTEDYKHTRTALLHKFRIVPFLAYSRSDILLPFHGIQVQSLRGECVDQEELPIPDSKCSGPDSKLRPFR